MSKYNITYNAQLDETITFTVEADSQEEAFSTAETVAWDILMSPSFSNENMAISCKEIKEQAPTYTPLSSSTRSQRDANNSTYTPLASLLTSSRNPSLTSPAVSNVQNSVGYIRFI